MSPWALLSPSPAAAALVALLLVAAAALYAFATRHFAHWRRRGVPFLPPLPFAGNLKDLLLFRMNIGELLQRVYSTTEGHSYMGMFFFDKPVLFIRDFSLWRDILTKDYEYFSERAFAPCPADTLFSETLFARKGDPWKNLRSRLSSAFSTGKLRKFCVLMNEKAKNLGTCFDEAALAGRSQDVMNICGRYAMDAVSTMGFGIDSSAVLDANDPLYLNLCKVFEYSKVMTVAMVATFVNHPLVHLLKVPLVPPSLAHFLRTTIWGVVRQREQAGRRGARGDYLDVLMELREKGRIAGDRDDAKGDCDLEGDAFISQAFTLLSAVDTTMAGMTYAMYHMAKDQSIQDKLREKLQKAMEKHGGELTYEALQSVEYMEMIMSETLRMYPIFPFLDRICNKNYRIPGSDLVLKKGDVVITSMLGFHRDPNLFPDPEIFDPERFSEENKNSIPSGAYSPFGEGPRKCIGLRLSSLQTKLGLAHIVLNYRLHTCTATPEEIKYVPYTFFIHPQGGVPLKFSRI